MSGVLASTQNSHATLDWMLATTLVGGAYAFHVDMAELNQFVAFGGGMLGIALGAARLYFFIRDRWNMRDESRDSVRDSARDFSRDTPRDAARDSAKDAEMDRDR
jgi:hypothetical protein